MYLLLYPKKKPKGTRIIKQKLAKKLTQKKKPITQRVANCGGRRRVAMWGWEAKGR